MQSGKAIRQVNESETKLRLCADTDVRERSEIFGVLSIPWHRHVNQIKRASQPGDDRICDARTEPQTWRLNRVPMAEVAVAQMNEQVGPRGYSVAKLGRALDQNFEFRIRSRGVFC